MKSSEVKGLLMKPASTFSIGELFKNASLIARSNSGTTLQRMKSETLFGKPRGDSVHSQNGGSQARGIEVPKVVKGIHASNATETSRSPGVQSKEEGTDSQL